MQHKITFHFFNNSSIYSKLIQFRFGTPVTHVGVAFEDGRYYESLVDKGNVRLDKPIFKEPPVLSVSILVDSDHYYKARDAANGIHGKPYDKKAVLGFMLGMKLQSDDKFFCSELGRHVFEAATGKQIKMQRLCSPYDLYLMTATHAHP